MQVHIKLTSNWKPSPAAKQTKDVGLPWNKMKSQTLWILFPALPQISCTTLGQQVSLSVAASSFNSYLNIKRNKKFVAAL